ncbi:NACHT domain-containing protein [Dactylosporangium sp. CS-033363]|uniref:NACHT domain-containing protein n=1 Tax=Dactylosporangium sp. CS-033363 TaxID=3239935 RepID=UPI003D902A80
MPPRSKPVTAITYADVRRMVADEPPALLAAADGLITASLALSPVVLGHLAVPLLSLFDLKSDVVRLAGDLARRVARRGERFLDRSESLAAAHLLITHTAFWAAADDELGELLRAAEIDDSLITRGSGAQRWTGEDAYAGLPPVSLPHPTARFADEDEQRRAMYSGMRFRLAARVRESAAWPAWDDWRRDQFLAGCDALPGLAMRHYYAQYLDLMLASHDFFTWAAAYEHAKTQALVVAETAAIDSRLGRVLAAVEGVDVGLHRLAAALAPGGAVPEAFADVVDALAVAHERQAAEPVIVDAFVPRPGEAALRYPARIDAFVPQAYRELRYPDTRISLEDERLWAGLTHRDDVAAAVVRALDSPYSITAPLLVLGHPGSGKSLLTEVLAARLPAGGYHVVRLKLRDVTPGTPVQTQIEEQIRLDSGRAVNWAELGRALAGQPMLVILDGYDELLQSNGQVFADYLQQVHAFQRRELALDRPVRVLVTSRVTLIDKAAVPPGTAVLRLAEFDPDRQRTWARDWNALNAGYYERTGVRPFTPPADPGLRDLAGQPLLLLLLAIYDSQANQLGDAALDRTSLYHSLLSRFIERELTKGDAAAAAWSALADAERRAALDRELDRLGVAALGMFNRRAVHISRADLGADLEYHGSFRLVEGGTLSPADTLLGSFFFIHESRSRSGDPDDSSRGAAASFEFLHTTFGEFLTADLILRRIVLLASQIHVYRTSPLLAADLSAKLADPGDACCAALSFEALHHRPLVAQMLREWLPHRLAAASLAPADFTSALHAVVERQLFLALHAAPPRWFTEGAARAPYPALPMLGSLSVYSLNLVVLSAVLGGIAVADTPSDDATSDWARLTSLWRSWFPSKSLVGLAGVIHGTRNGATVEFHPASGVEYGGPEVARDAVYEAAVVAVGLADDLTAGLATYLVGRSEPGGHGMMRRALDFLDSTGFDTHWERLALDMREGGVLPALLDVVPNAALADAVLLAGSQALPQAWEPPGAFSELERLPSVDAGTLIGMTAAMDPLWLINQLGVFSRRDLPMRSPVAGALLRAARHGNAWPNPPDLALDGAALDAAVEYALILAQAGRDLGAVDRTIAGVAGAPERLAALPEETWLELLRLVDRLPRTGAALLGAGAGSAVERRALARLVVDPQAWTDDNWMAFEVAGAVGPPVIAVLLRAARRHGVARTFVEFLELAEDDRPGIRRRLGLAAEPSSSDPDLHGDLEWLWRDLGPSGTAQA